MSEHEKLKRLSDFLCDYAACLMSVGMQTSRVEKNTARIAGAYATGTEMSFFHKSVILTLWDADRLHSYTAVRHIQPAALNFETNARLSRLSWMIHDKRMPMERAQALFRHVVARPRYNRWLVLLAVACANASFCRLFRGDAPAMMLVFVATLVGFYLKQSMQQWKWNEFAVFLLCAFVSSAFGSLGYLLGWSRTPDMALGASVLYLVPGVPLINGVTDILDGHTVTGNTRLFNAALLVVCIALGLSFTLFITGVTTL